MTASAMGRDPTADLFLDLIEIPSNQVSSVGAFGVAEIPPPKQGDFVYFRRK